MKQAARRRKEKTRARPKDMATGPRGTAKVALHEVPPRKHLLHLAEQRCSHESGIQNVRIRNDNVHLSAPWAIQEENGNVPSWRCTATIVEVQTGGRADGWPCRRMKEIGPGTIP